MVRLLIIGFVLIGCVQQTVRQKEAAIRLAELNELPTEMTGSKVYVGTYRDWEKYPQLVQQSIEALKAHYTSLGFRLVGESQQAHLAILVGTDTYDEKHEGVTLAVRRLFVTGVVQDYGVRPRRLFDATAVFYTAQKPHRYDIEKAYRTLVARVKKITTKPVEPQSPKNPGCYPQFGYEASDKEKDIGKIKFIAKDGAFEAARIKVADKILAVDGKNYSTTKDHIKYDTKQGTRFVFLRKGRSFDKLIKPKIKCQNVSDW